MINFGVVMCYRPIYCVSVALNTLTLWYILLILPKGYCKRLFTTCSTSCSFQRFLVEISHSELVRISNWFLLVFFFGIYKSLQKLQGKERKSRTLTPIVNNITFVILFSNWNHWYCRARRILILTRSINYQITVK